jgi:hypothetical protein
LLADLVLERVRSAMLSAAGQRAVVQSVSQAGNQPRDVILFAIANTARSMLATGQHHIYRGVLSMEGTSLRAAFTIALSELVKSGFADEQQAREQRELLAQDIKGAG